MRKLRILALAVIGVAGCGDDTPTTPTAIAGYDATYASASFDIPPGGDLTYCTFVRATNDVPVDVSKMHVEQVAGGHHLIIYAVDNAIDHAPTQRPQGGQPGWAQLAVSQQAHEDIELPSGIGVQLKARQQFVVETHFINATQKPISAHGSVSLKYAAPGSVMTHAGNDWRSSA